jgi:phosphomannomutase
VINIGMVSTDQFYFACSQKQLPGMMVTASHNPKEYSGFKMVRRMPYLLSGAEGIQDLRRIVETEAYAPAARQGSMSELDLSEQFVAAVLGLLDVGALKPLKVVADTGNGMVGPILKRVFERLPVDLVGPALSWSAAWWPRAPTPASRSTGMAIASL